MLLADLGGLAPCLPVLPVLTVMLNISMETLLKDGWQVAGYAAANQFAVKSAMILLRHADQSYLVQCRASFSNPQAKHQLALLQAALSAWPLSPPSRVRSAA